MSSGIAPDIIYLSIPFRDMLRSEKRISVVKLAALSIPFRDMHGAVGGEPPQEVVLSIPFRDMQY